jgi:hypothetical protein
MNEAPVEKYNKWKYAIRVLLYVKMRSGWRSNMGNTVKNGFKCVLALGLILAAAAAAGVNSSFAAGDSTWSIEGPPGGFGSLSWEYEGITRTAYYNIYNYKDTSGQYTKKVYYDKNNRYLKTNYQ